MQKSCENKEKGNGIQKKKSSPTSMCGIREALGKRWHYSGGLKDSMISVVRESGKVSLERREQHNKMRCIQGTC